MEIIIFNGDIKIHAKYVAATYSSPYFFLFWAFQIDNLKNYGLTTIKKHTVHELEVLVRKKLLLCPSTSNFCMIVLILDMLKCAYRNVSVTTQFNGPSLLLF